MKGLVLAMSEGHKWRFGNFGILNNRVVGFISSDGKLAHFVNEDCSTSFGNLSEIKYVPDCDSFDWQPPKPIEPPEGYRMLTEGVVVGGDMCFVDDRWHYSACIGYDIDYLIKNGHGRTYARKIEPKVRPMTRAEFLAAWKVRNFCPLIDPNDDIDVIHRVIIDDNSEDENIVYLYDAGWCSLDELVSYKFASDETFLHVEE